MGNSWRTGILVYLHGAAPEKTIGWRTDIDGLPIVEQKQALDFASKHEGRMHAGPVMCDSSWRLWIQLNLGTTKQHPFFLFQPAEENRALVGCFHV